MSSNNLSNSIPFYNRGIYNNKSVLLLDCLSLIQLVLLLLFQLSFVNLSPDGYNQYLSKLIKYGLKRGKRNKDNFVYLIYFKEERERVKEREGV